MPLRILYVSPLPPPHGGISVWTRILVDRGLPDGHELDVVDTARRPGAGLLGEGWRTARILTELARQLARRRPDVVHINVAPLDRGPARDLACAWLARARGVPVVVHHRGPASRIAEPQFAGARRRILHRLVRTAQLNLVLDRASEAYLARLLPPVSHGRAGPRPRVVQIPNFFAPLDDADPGSQFVDAQTREADAQAARTSELRPRVAFVGDLIAAKGLPAVVELARRVGRADFELFGRQHAESAGLLAGAPANLHLHGEVPQARVREALRGCRVFLLPSRSEGFPMAICEAMALGLPVVASPVGAIPEMLDGERGGFLADPDDLAGLERAVVRLLDERELAQRMGEHNRERSADRYAFGAVTRRLVELYQGLVPGSV